jgi:hypothetical protein
MPIMRGTPFAFMGASATFNCAIRELVTGETIMTMNDLRNSGAGVISDELAKSSRMARVGLKLIHLAITVSAARQSITLLTLAAVSLIGLVEPAFAQSVLNGDAQRPIRAFQNLITIALWGSIGAGILGLIWAGISKMSGKAWGPQAIGGGALLGIGGIVALVNYVANGNLPDLGDW